MNIEPVYKSFQGWNSDISAVSDYNSMPGKMKTYIDFINSFLDVPVKYISNGPGRDQIVSVS
jgi:adenylosuccinate synthase